MYWHEDARFLGTGPASGGSGGPTWIDANAVGTNYWQQNGTSLAPLDLSDSLVLGGNTSTEHVFEVNGTKQGKALAILNETV